MKKRLVWVLFLAIGSFYLLLAQLPSEAMTVPLETEVLIKVSEKGFLDADGNPLNNLLHIPKNTQVKLVFEYAGKPGDEHELSLLFESEEERYSEPISYLSRRSHITFFSGDAGEKYDVFCLVDCDGMENLADLVLVVV